jgi:hypothetical protein
LELEAAVSGGLDRIKFAYKHGCEVHVPAYDRLRGDAHTGKRVRDIMVASRLAAMCVSAQML